MSYLCDKKKYTVCKNCASSQNFWVDQKRAIKLKNRSRKSSKFIQKREAGQASLEFVLIGIVIMIVASALGVLWHLVSDGKFSTIISDSASHAISLGGAMDVFIF